MKRFYEFLLFMLFIVEAQAVCLGLNADPNHLMGITTSVQTNSPLQSFLGNCAVFQNNLSSNHLSGLSRYWAQEYVGADLLRERMLKHNINNQRNIVAVWDNVASGHGHGMSGLIQGDSNASVIPSSTPTPIVDVFNGQRHEDQNGLINNLNKCKENPSGCPNYINMSLGWRNNPQIARLVGDVVKKEESIFITSAGNDQLLLEQQQRLSAARDDIILVSSLETDGTPSRLSIAQEITIAVPSDSYSGGGGYLETKRPNESARNTNSTSGAAPQVTGALAAFELISGLQLNTPMAKKLLEKTALPIPDTPQPSMVGKGMLNTYMIGEVAFRLKEHCKDASSNQLENCLKEAFENKSDLFDKAENTELINSLSDYFPSCATSNNQVTSQTVPTCNERKDYFNAIRREALITQSPELFEAISCISRNDLANSSSNQFGENAKFYANMAKRLRQTDQDIHNYMASGQATDSQRENYFRNYTTHPDSGFTENQLISMIQAAEKPEEIGFITSYFLGQEKWFKHPRVFESLFASPHFEVQSFATVAMGNNHFNLIHPILNNNFFDRLDEISPGSSEYERMGRGLLRVYGYQEVNNRRMKKKIEEYLDTAIGDQDLSEIMARPNIMRNHPEWIDKMLKKDSFFRQYSVRELIVNAEREGLYEDAKRWAQIIKSNEGANLPDYVLQDLDTVINRPNIHNVSFRNRN
jgi:hypothetical protein